MELLPPVASGRHIFRCCSSKPTQKRPIREPVREKGVWVCVCVCVRFFLNLWCFLGIKRTIQKSHLCELSLFLQKDAPNFEQARESSLFWFALLELLLIFPAFVSLRLRANVVKPNS